MITCHGDLVLFIYWQDNYFSILPGRSQRVKVEFDVEDLAGEKPSLIIGEWNIKSEEITISIL